MGGFMFKSSRRDQAEGGLDRLAGRLLEAIGRLTGRRSYQAKGKAARARGAVRGRKGRANAGDALRSKVPRWPLVTLR